LGKVWIPALRYALLRCDVQLIGKRAEVEKNHESGASKHESPHDKLSVALSRLSLSELAFGEMPGQQRDDGEPEQERANRNECRSHNWATGHHSGGLSNRLFGDNPWLRHFSEVRQRQPRSYDDQEQAEYPDRNHDPTARPLFLGMRGEGVHDGLPDPGSWLACSLRSRPLYGKGFNGRFAAVPTNPTPTSVGALLKIPIGCVGRASPDGVPASLLGSVRSGDEIP